METAVYFMPWLLCFVYMALWLQSRRHYQRALTAVDSLCETCQTWEKSFKELKTANDTLHSVIDRYEALHPSPPLPDPATSSPSE